MTLQNRSDPAGMLHAVPSRGMFTGNRGIIHEPSTRTLLTRRWTTKSWIVCRCEWKGRKREPMGGNRPGGKAGWTELFFLDEVTGLAAGHRPCFTCRRKEAVLFADAFAKGNAMRKTHARQIDERLHRERMLSGKSTSRLVESHDLQRLPSGSVVLDGDNFYALKNGKVLPWSFDGYRPPVDETCFQNKKLRLVTPQSTAATLEAGYEPVWHKSAN
jgi:hypothetical protein